MCFHGDLDGNSGRLGELVRREGEEHKHMRFKGFILCKNDIAPDVVMSCQETRSENGKRKTSSKSWFNGHPCIKTHVIADFAFWCFVM